MGVDAQNTLMTLAGRFIADVEATTPLRPTCSVGPDGEIPASVARFSHKWFKTDDGETVKAMLVIGSSFQGETLWQVQFDEHRFDDVLVALADEWSEAVMEALIDTVGVEAARTWPKCPVHDHAMDPKAEGGRAWWICRDDQSVRVPIGELTTQ